MLLKRFECENFLFSYLNLFLKKGYISYNEVMNIIDIWIFYWFVFCFWDYLKMEFFGVINF